MVWLLQTLGRWTPTWLDFLTDLGAVHSEAWLCPVVVRGDEAYLLTPPSGWEV